MKHSFHAGKRHRLRVRTRQHTWPTERDKHQWHTWNTRFGVVEFTTCEPKAKHRNTSNPRAPRSVWPISWKMVGRDGPYAAPQWIDGLATRWCLSDCCVCGTKEHDKQHLRRHANQTTLIDDGPNMCWASGCAGKSDGVTTPRKNIGNQDGC